MKVITNRILFIFKNGVVILYIDLLIALFIMMLSTASFLWITFKGVPYNWFRYVPIMMITIGLLIYSLKLLFYSYPMPIVKIYDGTIMVIFLFLLIVIFLESIMIDFIEQRTKMITFLKKWFTSFKAFFVFSKKKKMLNFFDESSSIVHFKKK